MMETLNFYANTMTIIHEKLGQVKIVGWNTIKFDENTVFSYQVQLANPPKDPDGKPYKRTWDVLPESLTFDGKPGTSDYRLIIIPQSYLESLQKIAQLAESLCQECKRDYIEDVWGERQIRIDLEKLLEEIKDLI
jgi:hypothetical protein